MQWRKQNIFNDMTLPIGMYARVIQKLDEQQCYSDEILAIGDIVFQAKAYGPWPDNFQIFNVTKGITGYTNPSHWRQSNLARKPFILVELIK